MSALLCLGIVVLGIYLFRLSRANTVSVDPAYTLLQAEDFLHGNWLLHGWLLAPNSLRFTEMPVYAAGIAIFGLTSALFYLVPVAICVALIVALVMAATVGLSAARAPYFVAALPILPIVFPSPTMRAQVLMGPFHTGTMVTALVSMVALYHAQGDVARPGRRRVLTYLAFFLLTAAAMSDPYITIMALGPIASVSLVRIVACRDSEERRGYASALLVAVAAWFLGLVGIWWVRLMGGAGSVHYTVTPIAYSQIGQSLSNLWRAVVGLAGGDMGPVPAVPRLAYLFAGVVATCLALRDEIGAWSGHRPRADWLTTVLAASAALLFIGNVLGTSSLDVRYRLPMFLMAGAVLARRSLGAVWAGRRTLLATVLGFVFIFAYAGPVDQYLDPASERDSSYADLARWLAAHRLHYGYGGFQESSIVTVESRGAVKVRPVISTKVTVWLNQSGLPPARWRLIPYLLMSKYAWYTTGQGRFVVVDPMSPWDRATGVDSRVAANTFGRPDHTYEHVGRFTVLVWDKHLP